MSRLPPFLRLPPGAMRELIKEAVILAGAGFLAAYPLTLYQAAHLIAPALERPPTPDQLQTIALFHTLMTFFACLLCALVGFFYSPRLELPGLGSWANDRRTALGLWLAGTATIPFAYRLVDARLMELKPGYFPADFAWAAALTVGHSVAPEIIARFGLFTIGVYFCRWFGLQGRPWPAHLALALFGAAGAWLMLDRLELHPGADSFTAACLVSAFVSNLVFNEVYWRKGLLCTMALRLGVELKYLVYAGWLF